MISELAQRVRHPDARGIGLAISSFVARVSGNQVLGFEGDAHRRSARVQPRSRVLAPSRRQPGIAAAPSTTRHSMPIVICPVDFSECFRRRFEMYRRAWPRLASLCSTSRPAGRDRSHYRRSRRRLAARQISASPNSLPSSACRRSETTPVYAAFSDGGAIGSPSFKRF
jgi:hypothetical protein